MGMSDDTLKLDLSENGTQVTPAHSNLGRDIDLDKIQHRFGPYRPPTPDTIPKYKAIQSKALEFAELIHELCPHSQQKATALTLLEQVKMSANAAVALHSS